MVIFNKKEHWIEENAMSGFRTDPVYRNRPRPSTEQRIGTSEPMKDQETCNKKKGDHFW